MTINRIFSFKRVQNYWRRQGFVKYVFLLIFLGFAYQTTNILSGVDSNGLSIKDRGQSQAYYSQTQYARRGDILDRHGHILASNLILKKVNIDPMLIQDEYLPALAKALEMDLESLRNIIQKKRDIKSKYLIIKKNIALNSQLINNIQQLKKQRLRICRQKQVKNKVALLDRALDGLGFITIQPSYRQIELCRLQKISGLALQQDSKRYYPKSASLAPLLGRINNHKRGISGVEGEFESLLAGQNAKQILSSDQRSGSSYFQAKTLGELEHGKDIQLTIDADVQFHTYAALKKSVHKHEADSGSAIILDPNGEILALANYPADDPNDKSSYKPAHWRNRVLADKVEPGSTMKPFTMLLALEQDKISANDDELIDVSKSIGHVKTNAEVRKYGEAITVKKILQKSHNLGTVNVSERLSKEDMFNTWYQLGFGQPLGLLPSIESAGTLRHHNSWGLADKRTLSFGHGPMQTNLAQLAKAYLVFANEGATRSLKLIKDQASFVDKTQVFSAEPTAKIAQLLDSVASDKGSGYRAQIKGYKVAGKTGTAEMVVDGKYHKKGAKRTFFAGFVPVEKPKYIMVVRLDYPKKCYTYYDPSIRNKCEGSNSAAMVFRDTMHNILSSDTSLELIASN